MGPKRKADTKKPNSTAASSRGGKKAGKISPKAAATAQQRQEGNGTNKGIPPLAGYVISCDIPTKQFIQNLNDKKTIDKKFILEDLDAEHLLIKISARAEIEREVEKWMDENVFSAIERVGENLDMS